MEDIKSVRILDIDKKKGRGVKLNKKCGDYCIPIFWPSFGGGGGLFAKYWVSILMLGL